MFIVRRSLPPYPISTVFRAVVSGMVILFAVGAPAQGAPRRLASPSAAARSTARRSAKEKSAHSFHGRRGRRNQDRGLHTDEQRQRFREKRLPLGIAERLRARGRPLVEVFVDPEVHRLVELPGLRLPIADVAGVFLAARQHALGEAEPLADLPDLRAIPAQLVEVAAVGRRLERRDRRQHLVLLGEQQRADLRYVALRPLVVLRELAAQPVTLVEARIAPEVHVLVEHAELGGPAALELAVLVAADLAADLGVELEVLGLLAGLERIGAQLVDHDPAPLRSAIRCVGRVDGVVLAQRMSLPVFGEQDAPVDRKSTRLNSSHVEISYAVFCLKKKKI